MADHTPFDPDTVYQPEDFLTVTWYADHQIVAYRLTEASRHSIDAWASVVVPTINTWNLARPYLALHDLSTSGVVIRYRALQNNEMLNLAVTQHAYEQVKARVEDTEGFSARVALLVSSQYSGHLANLFATLEARSHLETNVVYNVFTDERASALTWLYSFIDDQE